MLNAVWAIVADTWRQSKQQVVFIIMLCLMLIVGAAAVIFPKTYPAEVTDDVGKATLNSEIDELQVQLDQLVADRRADQEREDRGEEREREEQKWRREIQEVQEEITDRKDRMNRQFGLIFTDDPVDFFASSWIDSYAKAQQVKDGRGDEPIGPRGYTLEARIAAEEEAASISRFQRSIEAYVYMAVSIMVTISMYFFIAACSGYFPGLLASGAVDVVLAKPITRLGLLLGKFFGGIALFGAALFAFNLLVYLGVGLRTGVFVERIFLSMPLQIFTAALLYAILGLVGILFRSTPLAMILGFIFYMFVDSMLAMLLQLQKMGVFEENLGWLDTTAKVLGVTLPNFSVLKDTSLAMIMQVPTFDWTPFLVAGAWLVGCLSLGYAAFRTRDF